MTDGEDKDLVENEPRLAYVRLSPSRLYLQGDEFPQAQRAFESAAESLRRLRKQQPASMALMRHLAEAYHGLGDLYLAQGDLPRAASAYEQAKKLREGLYRTNPRDPEQRFQYARGLANFGELDRGYRGRLDYAIEQLIAAERIQRELADDFDEVENFRTDLGGTENMLAEIYLMAAADAPARSDCLAHEPRIGSSSTREDRAPQPCDPSTFRGAETEATASREDSRRNRILA